MWTVYDVFDNGDREDYDVFKKNYRFSAGSGEYYSVFDSLESGIDGKLKPKPKPEWQLLCIYGITLDETNKICTNWCHQTEKFQWNQYLSKLFLNIIQIVQLLLQIELFIQKSNRCLKCIFVFCE